MRHQTVIWFIGILFCNALSSKDIIINDPDWPPYFFKGESYQPIGFAKELLLFCLPKTGYQTRFIYHPIKRMRSYIETGKIDVHIYSYKPNRDAFLHFGKEPIFKSSYKPFINRKSPFEINTLEDFKGLRIGHLQGLKYSADYLNFLESKWDSGYLRSVTTNVSLVTLLYDQKIDTFVNTVDTVYWLSTTLGMREDIVAVDFDIQTKEYFVAISKKSNRIKDKKAFLNTLDTCIKEAKTSGLYDNIKAGYGI